MHVSMIYIFMINMNNCQKYTFIRCYKTLPFENCQGKIDGCGPMHIGTVFYDYTKTAVWK